MNSSESIHYLKKQIEKVISLKKDIKNNSFIIANHINTKNIDSSNVILLENISKQYDIPYIIDDVSLFKLNDKEKPIKKSKIQENIEKLIK